MAMIQASELRQGMTVQTGDTVVVTLTKVKLDGDRVQLTGRHAVGIDWKSVTWTVKASQRVRLISRG